MATKHLALIAGALALAVSTGTARAEGLAGTVSSAQEGLMEGVVVSAKKVGSTITTSVATDDKGRFSFPAGRLEPGQYALSIRAIGYDLEGPRSADVATGKTESVEIKLAPTRNLAKQMSNAEWLASFPGTDNEKKALLNCVSCHDLDRIVRSQYDGEQFVDIFNRMVGYYPGSTPQHPQRLVGNAQRTLGQGPNMRTVAEYLASVNLSKETWSYPLKTLPRLTGRSNRFIITEYALPRPLIQPHDVILDEQGTVWFTHFAEQFLGRMDPKTGKVSEYPIPVLKPGYPTGTLDLGIDKAGNLWIGMMYQGGVARFDKKTETFKTWSIPKEWQADATQSGHLEPAFTHVDGKVWVKNSDGSQILRLDVESGQWENVGSFSAGGKRMGVYGIRADSRNNLYLLDFQSSAIGIIDAKTGKFTAYSGEIANSRPRRGAVDEQDRLWYAEYAGNAIGMFDPKTKAIKEWVVPTPWAQPYDVVTDKNGEAWTGSMMSDRVSRLDPKTGQYVEYQLPKTTNIRRVFVDNSTTPVTFWTGSNHGAAIIKLEPLD
ncbi:virginiamycin B lyase family protein [Rhodoplanes sp. Z2-YC6860]|uniref:virginiamycin B lyase family protein n=1 Tax=Rhodoplanes sp. Z2-YC6860 TaxID=674703 RepID=UPI00078D05FF|nr:carboxypeptidase regulatory-like domain-containing protein [Rhodoplanes sp. Z2-YC6860]AMN42764.1 streptogramin lyase [Rhodoplanes sp. Z2-YC6860]